VLSMTSIREEEKEAERRRGGFYLGDDKSRSTGKIASTDRILNSAEL
jgi:hypothetical protein